MALFFSTYILHINLFNKQHHQIKCVGSDAHLVDTLDCLFDKGWVCRSEWWPDSLRDSLQNKKKTFHTTFLENKQTTKTTQRRSPRECLGWSWLCTDGDHYRNVCINNPVG